LNAITALSQSPRGFSLSDVHAKVHSTTGQHDYTIREAAYDLKKLRAKQLVAKLGRSRRYQVVPVGVRPITALLILRDHVIKPILAGGKASAPSSKPPISTPVDHRYDQLRIDVQPPLPRARHCSVNNAVVYLFGNA
jgi:hypothetical protein